MSEQPYYLKASPFTRLLNDPSLRMDTAQAIAGRMSNEAQALSDYVYPKLGLPNQNVPRSYQDAYNNSFAHFIDRWIKFPVPQAAIFENEGAIVDEIDSGDWQQLMESTDDPILSRMSVLDTKRTIASQQRNLNDTSMHPFPERQHDGMVSMLSQALDLSNVWHRPPAFFYKDDYAYTHLVSQSFSPDDYLDRWYQNIKKIDEELILRQGVALKVNSDIANSRGGITDVEEIETKIEAAIMFAQKRPDTMAFISTLTRRVQTVTTDYAHLQHQRFWESTELSAIA